MHETLEELKRHLWVVIHHRWLALGAMAALFIVGAVVVQVLPNQFEVETRVYLDTGTVLKPILHGLAVDNPTREESALLMRRTLITRPNIEEVIRETDLDLTIYSPRQMEATIDDLMQRISVELVQPKDVRRRDEITNIYRITYRDEDPEIAKRVVEELLNIFVERILGESRQDTNIAERFLDQQIRDYGRRLDQAEDRLKQFRLQHLGQAADDGQSYFARHNALEAKLDEARLKLREAEDRRRALEAQIATVNPMKRSDDQGQTAAPKSPLETRIERMETKLDELLLQYTENHPDVVSTRRVLKELYAQREEEAKNMDDAEREKYMLEENPIYQELKVLLGQTEGEVAAAKARVSEYQERLDELQSLIETIPQVEAEMARLTRDYQVEKKTYEELVQRRESARLSSSAEESADNVQFRIIEPPRVPLLPVSPDRPKLLTMVFAVSSLGGMGSGWLLGQLKPTFYTRRRLAELTEYPVIGSVSMVWSSLERSRRKLGIILFAVGFGVLVVAYGVLLLHYLPITSEEIFRIIKDAAA